MEIAIKTHIFVFPCYCYSTKIKIRLNAVYFNVICLMQYSIVEEDYYVS